LGFEQFRQFDLAVAAEESEIMKARIEKNWRWLVALGAVFVPGVVSGALSLPFTFTSGSPIRASEVNANFEALRAKLDAVQGTAALPVVGTLTIAGTLTSVPIRKLGLSLTAAAGAKPVLSDIEVARDLGTGTPVLNLNVNRGTRVASADIVVGNLTIHLTNVGISRMQISGAQAGIPLEGIWLSYGTIEWRYPGPTGAIRTLTYDRAANSGASSPATSLAFGYFGAGVTPVAGLLPIQSYTHNMQCPDGTPVGGSCKVGHAPIAVQRPVTIETLDDFGLALTAKRIPVDVQWFATSTMTERVQLTDAFVSSVSLSTKDGVLSTSTDYSYTQITWTVGAVTSSWNVATGTGG
jgi:type VI protein secretion system component Hcp